KSNNCYKRAWTTAALGVMKRPRPRTDARCARATPARLLMFMIGAVNEPTPGLGRVRREANKLRTRRLLASRQGVARKILESWQLARIKKINC
ncbi:MAG: hypothetical protein ACKVS6_13535, partial [Planctomycetota bacterium]